MAMTLYATIINNNSGSKIFWQGNLERALTIDITSTGASINGGDQFTGSWGYGGSGTFLGLATSPNASTPTYPVGASLTTAYSTLNLYVVEEGGGGGSKTLTVKYNGNNLINTSGDVNRSLACNGKVMSSDIDIILR